MKAGIKIRHRAAVAAITAAALFITAPSGVRPQSHGIEDAAPLRCIVALPDGSNERLHAYLAAKFAEDNGLPAEIALMDGDGTAATDSLRSGAADMVICGYDGLSSDDGLLRSRIYDGSTVWMLRKDEAALFRTLNMWLADVMKAHGRTSRTVAALGDEPGTLSSYDALIRKSADRHGLDWRFLSSVIYHESRFYDKAVSGRGAVGLMQIVPSAHNRDDLDKPETNIEFGADLIDRLIKMFGSHGADSTEAVKFALAAYNIGSARMLRYISFAAGNDADSTRLRGVMEAVSDMEGFNGSRVHGYVDSVLNTYYDYTRLYGK